ncbi:MAG: methylated-DNA--[protein]-cysteine S-methyltransferase [Solirubrobacterales bacterium]|nr:methylated-DNA--[protein]-cysteine S-methyltransferase [Solirubrobacterales bacterium]
MNLIESPVGPLSVETNADGALTRLVFGALPGAEEDPEALPTLRRQLDQYFAGERERFELSLALEGSEWERRVWQALQRIPYGETRSYKQIAVECCERTGAYAARAVGRANHHNPVPIIVPCHRVIGADGSLVGFGGGLEVKRQLLDLEAGRLALL